MDTHQVPDFGMGGNHSLQPNRDKLDITLRLADTATARFYMARYAEDFRVEWEPSLPSADILPAAGDQARRVTKKKILMLNSTLSGIIASGQEWQCSLIPK